MIRLSIRERLDVVHASRVARSLADRVGFGSREQAEIGIVVMELGSNVLKHAGAGSLEVSTVVDEAHGPGMEIVAEDGGPQIRDLELALEDGCDDRGRIPPELLHRRGGLGAGLGAVVRLTDAFEHTPAPEGKRIRVVRYLRTAPPVTAPPRIS